MGEGIFSFSLTPHGRQGVQGQLSHTHPGAGSPMSPPSGLALLWCPGEVQGLSPECCRQRGTKWASLLGRGRLTDEKWGSSPKLMPSGQLSVTATSSNLEKKKKNKNTPSLFIYISSCTPQRGIITALPPATGDEGWARGEHLPLVHTTI